MSETVRAVVFDLDGTLVDSMPLVLRAYAHALAPFRPGMSDEAVCALLGGPPDRFFNELLGDPGHAAEALRRLEEFGAANWRLIEPFAGMAETIDALGRQCAVAIWTGRERASTEWLLREHGISGNVRACVCGDDLASHKPDPAGLREALRQLGVKPEEAIFVGDADVDVLAGAEAGVRTVLIEHGRAISLEIRNQAWRIVGTPTEAYALLRQTLTGIVYEK